MFESVYDSPAKLQLCTECRQAKPATTRYFYKNSHCAAGLDTQCKECKKRKRRRHYKAQTYARSKGIVI